MKIINIKYKKDIEILLNLKNGEIFVIKYLVKIINKRNYYKIKNKKNIIYEDENKIKFNMNGLLCKIEYNDNNNINIFTINKYSNKNNVIDIIIDNNNYTGFIESYNSYKKYNKQYILQISHKILSIYNNNKNIYYVILNNNCFININCTYKCQYDTIYNEIIKVLQLLFFYKNIKKYMSYRYFISPSFINENIYDKLNRLNIYKYEIFNDISLKYIDYFDIIIYNKLKLFNKYVSYTDIIKNNILNIYNYNKIELNKYIEKNYLEIINPTNKKRIINLFNVIDYNKFIQYFKNNYIIWNKNINNNIFIFDYNIVNKIKCIELLVTINIYNNNVFRYIEEFYIDITNIIFYSNIFYTNIFIV